MRRRLSLQGLKKKEEGSNDSRRSSLPSPLKAWVGSGKKIKMEWVKRSFAAAAVAVDRAAKDLFLEDPDEDVQEMECFPRGQGQFREFKARYCTSFTAMRNCKYVPLLHTSLFRAGPCRRIHLTSS